MFGSENYQNQVKIKELTTSISTYNFTMSIILYPPFVKTRSLTK